jgi:radical SAM-linked protein
VDSSFLEAVLSRGDRRLGPLLRRVWELGARFDGWSDFFDIARWNAAFRELGIDPHTYTAAREVGAPLPWDHIDLGVTKAWLKDERGRAMRGITTPDCRTAACASCGLRCGDARALAAAPTPAGWRRMQAQLVAALGGGPEEAATVQASGEPHRYRIRYAKLGPLRLIGHLETGRLLVRLMRMARWPLAFSKGQRPHPKLGYGPPLPLGIEGEDELLDIRVTAPLSADHVAAVNRMAPEGLRILAYQPLDGRPESLAAAAAAADYRAEIPSDLAELARREGRLATFHDAAALIALKSAKGRQKTVDLKRCVLRIEWAGAAAEDRVPADIGGRVLLLRLRLQEPGGHVLGPLPVLREIFKWHPQELGRCRVIRQRLLDRGGEPLAR